MPHIAFLDVAPVPEFGVKVTTGAGDIKPFLLAFKSLMEEVFDSQHRTGMLCSQKNFFWCFLTCFQICILPTFI